MWPTYRTFRYNLIRVRLRNTLSTLPNRTESKDDIVKKLIYSSQLANDAQWKRFLELKKATKELRQNRLKIKEFVPSVSLKYLTENVETTSLECAAAEEEEMKSPPSTMPLKLKIVPTSNFATEDDIETQDYNSDPSHNGTDGSTVSFKTWANDYSRITNKLEEIDDADNEWVTKYGTSNPDVPSSRVPCGGCGANLHCRNASIPGFIPQEVFTECKTSDLRMIICQRCYFLQNHNTALSAAVDPKVYPNIISQIKRKQALVLLAIDTTDFPCSIWPGIVDLVGAKSPLFLVGNKVDLLWGDTKGWLTNVEKSLKSYFRKANVIGVQLISAKTGFGVEELISKLNESWNYQGDVYLVGCTNVGKSTLFNALLQSDYCKSKAVNLVQRATTAPWPGTTINLLKFPILRPEGWRNFLRSRRLQEDRTAVKENALKLQQMSDKDPNQKMVPQLIGHIGRTFHSQLGLDDNDSFSAPDFDNSKEPVPGSGLNPNDPDFVKGRWFYDTPGVLHNASILDLLTTDELMKVLPAKVLEPRTFVMKPGWTLFVGGLSRVDYLAGPINTVRWTLFASKGLPITICMTDVADEVYNKLLGTETLGVPLGNAERLKEWPQLKSPEVFKFSGISSSCSCADLILSSCGWIAITPPTKEIISVKPWTPDGRGIFVRSPALLPHAVSLRGSLHKGTPVYHRSKPTDKSRNLY